MRQGNTVERWTLTVFCDISFLWQLSSVTLFYVTPIFCHIHHLCDTCFLWHLFSVTFITSVAHVFCDIVLCGTYLQLNSSVTPIFCGTYYPWHHLCDTCFLWHVSSITFICDTCFLWHLSSVTLFPVAHIFCHIHHLCDTHPLFSDTCLVSSAVLRRYHVTHPPRVNPPSVALQRSDVVLPPSAFCRT